MKLVPLVFTLVPLLLQGCGPRNSNLLPNKHPIPSPENIQEVADRLMKRENVQGLALAIVDDGKVNYVLATGIRNEQKEPLTTQTVMYGASLTKTVVAYLTLQLVDDGLLNLDQSISDLLPRPLPEYEDYGDLVGDDRWKMLTPRIILSHTTGFANFRWLEPDGKLRFHHTPGTRYGYSGEGFYILQLALEEALGQDVGYEIQTRIFDRFGMTKTSMQWRPDFQDNLADGFRMDGSIEPHDERSSVSAAGSMDTTIDDQAKLWSGIIRGDGLSTASRMELVHGQIAIESKHQFPTLEIQTNPDNASIGLSAGLGVIAFSADQGVIWFKGGHNDWTGNMLICVENQKKCLVMLSNDVRAEQIYPELARFILGETGMPWQWEYNY